MNTIWKVPESEIKNHSIRVAAIAVNKAIEHLITVCYASDLNGADRLGTEVEIRTVRIPIKEIEEYLRGNRDSKNINLG